MRGFELFVVIVSVVIVIYTVECHSKHPRNIKSAKDTRRTQKGDDSFVTGRFGEQNKKIVGRKNLKNYEVVIYQYDGSDENESENVSEEQYEDDDQSSPEFYSASKETVSAILPQIKKLLQERYLLKHLGKSTEEEDSKKSSSAPQNDAEDKSEKTPEEVMDADPTSSTGPETTTTTTTTIATTTTTEQPQSESPVCQTSECIYAATDLLKSMDTTVNPCEDFYQFACGGWIRNNRIPPAKSSWNQIYIVEERLSGQIKAILESPINKSEPFPVQQAKTFYKSCKEHVESGDARGDLRQLGDKYLNDFNQTLENDKFGEKLGAIRRELGGDFIVGIRVALDEKNTTNYVVYLDQPSLGLDRHSLLQNGGSRLWLYNHLIELYWPIVYPQTNRQTISTIASEIIAFERLLAQISSAPEQRTNREELYRPYTLKELSEEFVLTSDVIKWTEYVGEVFKEVQEAYGIDLGDLSELRVIVRDVDYYRELGRILNNTITNDSHVLENYLRWRIITEFAAAMSRKFRDVVYRFEARSKGKLASPIRIKTCADIANSYFGMAISHQYVKTAFPEENKAQIGEMVVNIMDSFFEILNETKWISREDTRDKARVKAEKMAPFIAYPEWLLNTSALVEYYKELQLSKPDDVFRNYMEVTQWYNRNSLKNIGSTKDSTRWVTDPTTVNAFYYHTGNALIFPAGILQPPFYYTGEQIQALNYGSMGVVMGHEVTHGFDYSGKDRDEDGNLKDWWDKETLENYTKRAQCFINQYSKYEAKQLSSTGSRIYLNGNNTLDENIADNGGLRKAFRAYKAYVEKNGPEKQLPGLDFTPEQLFFLSFAHLWCGSYTQEGLLTQILTTGHSPHSFRVKGVLDNSKEFSETWNCREPNKNHCQLW